MNVAAWIRRWAFEIVLVLAILGGGWALNSQADDIQRNTDLIERNTDLAVRNSCARGNILRMNQRVVIRHLIRESTETQGKQYRALLATIPIVDCSQL